jgi:hypothetical protein
VFSVITVLGAFVCAGYTVLPPIARDLNNMTASTVFGMLVCCVVLFKFSAKIFGSTFKFIKRTFDEWHRKQQQQQERQQEQHNRTQQQQQ